ncbi:xanthine dehydrogenase family protein molybdopterin-binding subunit [Ottowia flava]|uniref:xanthine dehydrogenase family protein molybdopterin-binding subunit n=1 Tax=Ottowia flava TaxID=2675430 RepID=UPI00210301D5|nr:molybdopterin cofactor-binding domain-containing protein [Ottowia sp. GY511]
MFAIDLRAKNMKGWPDRQSYALTIHVPRADRIYEGLDLAALGPEFQPDVLIDAESIAADGVGMPEPSFYGDFFVKKGQVPPMLGHPVALAIWHDYEKFRVANQRLRFNDAIFRFGAAAQQPARAPYVAARFLRIQGQDAYGEDQVSPMKNTTVWPKVDEQGVHWPDASDPAFGELMAASARIQAEMKQPKEGVRTFARKYRSQSIDHVAMEMDNGLAWYDTATSTLHMVGATQAPYSTAEHVMHMVKASKLPLERLDYISAYTVGYGQKEHHPFPFYCALAALYAQGRPVRLALDRWKHFQFALKRHPFDVDTAISVDKDGKFQGLTCHMLGDGGGVMNFSPSVGTVAVTAAQSIYYFPQSDLSTQVNPSVGVTSGSMRGYGTVQSMAYTEMLVDEIAHELKLDAIELRQRNAMRSGMKNTQGASPAGAMRIGEILALAAKEPLWTERTKRKTDYEAAHPGMRYGVGFGAVQKDFGTGAEACIAQLEITPEGRIKMRHIATEIGTGSTTSQLIAVEPFLGRPADEVEFAINQWDTMPLETSDEPYTTPQHKEDELARNPHWVPRMVSPVSASNSAYYFRHATQQAAQLLLKLSMWPAAQSIWGGASGGGQLLPGTVSADQLEWRNRMLVAGEMEPLSLERLAARAHELGGVTGVCVHTFNRWAWAKADFTVDGTPLQAWIDALSVQYGQGASEAKKAAMTSGGYAFIPRDKVAYPPVQRNNAGTVYYAPCATMVELSVNGAGVVKILSHKTWLECGTQIVPELVSGQIQGGVAMGVGHALYEDLPTDASGPGNGQWGLSRYHVPRASEVAVWTAQGHVLPPLSGNDPPKGMAEVVMIPVVAACVNAVAHATGKRFYATPLTAEKIKEAR